MRVSRKAGPSDGGLQMQLPQCVSGMLWHHLHQQGSDECFYPKPRELRYLAYNIPKKYSTICTCVCRMLPDLGEHLLGLYTVGLSVIRISCHFSGMPGFGSLNQYLAELQAPGEGLWRRRLQRNNYREGLQRMSIREEVLPSHLQGQRPDPA